MMGDIKINFQIIKSDSRKVSNKNSFYMSVYPLFLDFFKQKLDRDRLLLGLSLVYSWMPKIPLNIKINEIDKALTIFEKKELEREDFMELKSIFNNSIIGTSKLLHFMYPEKYPIWDTNVCRYVFGGKAYNEKVNNINNYLKYLDFCNDLIKNNEKELAEIQKYFTNKFGVELSKMRTLELIFFQVGKTKK